MSAVGLLHALKVDVVDWRGEKQLVANVDLRAGELIVGERPVAFAETRPGEEAVAPWILLETILSSEPMGAAVAAADLKLTKWPLAPEDEATLDHLGRKYKRNPKKLAQLYHRVAANNIHYRHAGVMGFGIWPVLSRSNHSCDPNARLCASSQQPLVELLLATRLIGAGDAVSWNYFSDAAFLELGWLERNRRLYRDFQFLCRCSRCEAERPEGAGGLSNADIAVFLKEGK
ncbi:SET domain-containing protein [Polycyclovorans algicola]|uniref:SET domain-containing protein n=1 Tax=Polycyclovorans algicola TaxID=616992 RepID=UPI0004A71083|nr:SET domain-containing methyltransferase [Polycyclovorans algicola]